MNELNEEWVVFELDGFDAYYKRTGSMIEVHEFLGEDPAVLSDRDLTVREAQSKMPSGFEIDLEKHIVSIFSRIESKIDPETGVTYYQREFNAFVLGWAGFVN